MRGKNLIYMIGDKKKRQSLFIAMVIILFLMPLIIVVNLKAQSIPNVNVDIKIKETQGEIELNLIETENEGEMDEEVKEFIPSSIKGPVFSNIGGFYTEVLELSLSTEEKESKILYTLDGSVPSPMNKATKEYSSPFVIGYKALRDMDSNYFCGTIIRAIVVRKDNEVSDVVSNTYFVHKDMLHKYKLPIISLSTDPSNLYDYETGLFNNLEERGREWEKSFYFEYYDKDGNKVLQQNVGARLHGGASREFPFKSFRIYARKEYDSNSKLDYNFFEDSFIKPMTKNGVIEPIKSFKRLILRNGGNEGDAWDSSMFRDILIQSLMANTNLDLQAYCPTVAFLNGEFYGIINIQERQDEKYIAKRYRVKEEEVAIYDFWYDELGEQQVFMAAGGDEHLDFYLNMIQYIKENDMSDDLHYNKVSEWMDIENYVDYLIIQLYSSNTDWPGNNCRAYRTINDYNKDAPYGQDGRLRWLLFDTDFGFGLYNAPVNKDTLGEALAEGNTQWPNQDGSTFLFRSLLNNEGFKEYFITRFLDLINSNYQEEVVNEKIDHFASLYEASIGEFKLRYNKMGDWNHTVLAMKQYGKDRMNAARFMLNNHFKLGKYYTLQIDLNRNPIDAYVELNTLVLDNNSLGVEEGVFRGVYYDKLNTTLNAVSLDGSEFLHWLDGEGNIVSSDSIYTIKEVPSSFTTITLTPVFKNSKVITSKEETTKDKTTEVLANDVVLNNKSTTSYGIMIVFVIVLIIVLFIAFVIINKRQTK